MDFDKEDIRITKIRPYAVHFSCGEKKFMLHASSDGIECSLKLWTKDCNGNIGGVIAGGWIHSDWLAREVFGKYDSKPYCTLDTQKLIDYMDKELKWY